MKAATQQFTSAEQPAGGDCAGCCFEHERSSECHQAEAIAQERRIPTCEDRAPNGGGYIYIKAQFDPRQLRIIPTEEEYGNE